MPKVRLLQLRDVAEAAEELRKIGVDERAVEIMAAKAIGGVLKVEGLSCGAANILKQTALSSGADAAVHRDVITGKAVCSDLLLFGNLRELEAIGEKLKAQPFSLAEVGEAIPCLVKRVEKPGGVALHLPNHSFHLSQRTHIMGVLNVTPDSFSDGNLYLKPEKAVDRAYQLAEEGADILDIGGESTRPGSEPTSVDEELGRVMPVIERIIGEIDIPISIDTCKSKVAEEALSAGCEMVNDISGLGFDPEMAQTVADHQVGLAIMHIKGTPRDMQQDPSYDDLMGEIAQYLSERTAVALKAGVKRESILIDPGIGFGKTVEHNLIIIKRLGELKTLGFPILIGTSRKSFIGRILDLPVGERLEGTLASVSLSIVNGANIVRVHDVLQVSRACKIVDATLKATDS